MNRSMLLAVVFMVSCSTVTTATVSENDQCAGSPELPEPFKSLFSAVDDETLLNNALGTAGNGKLCQGRVYQLHDGAELTLYRAWNSTNPYSKMGSWWAFEQPNGSVAEYRNDYEICYQWSALDALVSCHLKPGSKVVVGNGQSAQCSEYLTYPVSATLQVYLEGADQVMENCSSYQGEFSWQLDD